MAEILNTPENSKPSLPKVDVDIVRAVLTPEGHIKISIYGNHTPSLCYIHKLLSVEIDKRIIDEKMRSMQGNSPIIKPNNGRGRIVDFIRGKKN